MNEKIVVLVGATGALGRLIAEALLDKGVRLRCLVRSGNRNNVSELEKRGAEAFEGSLDTASATALAKLCSGAYAVVSAVQGGDDVIVDGQMGLLRAAAKAGVRRFVPSTFSFNLFTLAEGENVMSDTRRRFAAAAEKEKDAVEVVHVLNGCFLDRRVLFGFLGAFDLVKGIAYLWGDGHEKMDFTTYHDTALYTAEAAIDEKPLPAQFNVAGDILNFHELVRAYEEATDRKLAVQRLGTMADLDERISHLVTADPLNVYAYLPLMYYRGMLSGKGKLGELINSRYPHIRPMTVREYVTKEGL